MYVCMYVCVCVSVPKGRVYVADARESDGGMKRITLIMMIFRHHNNPIQNRDLPV